MAFQFPNSPTVGQTVNNISSGQVFTWDGSAWNTSPVTSSQAVTSSYAVTASNASVANISQLQFRDYFPIRTVYNAFWRNSTQTPAQLGFTPVGTGASIFYWNSGGYYFNYAMLQTNATQATTTAAEWTVPTSYIRWEGAITPNMSNVFHMSTITDRGGFVRIDLWVCDPVTGVPVKKLIKNSTEIHTGGANFSKSTYMDPWGGSAQSTGGQIWLNYSIPKDIINTYKTSTNTIKLALRPGIANAEGTLWYINGVAMTANPFDFINLNANTIEMLSSPAYALGVVWDNSNWNYRSLVRIGEGSTGILYMPIMDINKPMILNTISAASITDQGFELNGNTYSLWSPSGVELNIGRGQKSLTAPSVNSNNLANFGVDGWVITPDQIQQYMIPSSSFNANAGYNYLRLKVNPMYYNTTYISGLASETYIP